MRKENSRIRSEEKPTKKPAIHKWGGVETQLEKAQPEIKADADAAEKQQPAAKRQQKRTPFDTGKMIALLGAGWKVPKVADEMGVSEATIYNYMKKEGIKLK